MNSRETLPMMLSANDIQTMGFTMGFRASQVQKKYTFFPTCFAVGLLRASAPKTPNIDKR